MTKDHKIYQQIKLPLLVFVLTACCFKLHHVRLGPRRS